MFCESNLIVYVSLLQLTLINALVSVKPDALPSADALFIICFKSFISWNLPTLYYIDGCELWCWYLFAAGGGCIDISELGSIKIKQLCLQLLGSLQQWCELHTPRHSCMYVDDIICITWKMSGSKIKDNWHPSSPLTLIDILCIIEFSMFVLLIILNYFSSKINLFIWSANICKSLVFQV